jgi:hypothetical protein
MQTHRSLRQSESCLLFVVLAAATPLADAQYALDGSRDAAYGAPLAVQTVETGFGDNDSELNAAYVDVAAGNLHLLVTGQVESNFNNLNIFIDSVPGGQNILENDANNGGTNPENVNWAGKYAGFTFDAGFAADYLIIARNGNAGADQFNLDFATVGGGLGAFEASADIFGGSLTGANAAVGAAGLGVAYDNSNLAGVLGGTAAADQGAAAAVTTGLEFVIPLAAIGNPGVGGTIRITAHINGSNHDFLSNQSLAGYPPPQINLGGDGAGTFTGTVAGIDLNDYAGNQYFALGINASDLDASARFRVTKTFSDGRTDPVDVTLTCNSGLPLEQSFTIAGGDPDGVLFVVTELQGDETECEVTESGGPAGYTPVFNGGDGCAWDAVTPGDYSCAISNEADPAEFTVIKEWVIEGAVGHEVLEQAGVTIYCNNPIVDGFFTGSEYAYSTVLSGDGDSVTVSVDTTQQPAWCYAEENTVESGVETENGCDGRAIPAGGSSSCTITNTVFFEGIPTLNQWGLALLALLMLGLGAVALRRVS